MRQVILATTNFNQNTSTGSNFDIVRYGSEIKIPMVTLSGIKFTELILDIITSYHWQENVKTNSLVIVTPRRKWKPASKGVIEDFSGSLSKVIPEFSDITEDKIEEHLSRKLAD